MGIGAMWRAMLVSVFAGACLLPVEAAGSIVGGVGVSGAPGGEQDDRCARDGIDAAVEQLEF
ncbi:MAG: heme-binding protein [Pseudomonadota bacterium]